MSLTIIDYILLVSTLLVSLGIGLYYAIFKKQNTTKDYLQGGKNMNFSGIALSIVASMFSGISMIGFTAETYYYGIHYGLQISVLMIPVAILTYFFVCPVFFKLQLISIFTYVELRFDAKVKKLTSFLNTLIFLLHAAINTYVTALTIVQITSIDVEIISAILAATCIIYTIFGGFKAIIWTDAFQLFIMAASIITQTGGIKNVTDVAFDSGRLTIDFGVDLTKRDTFLATFCDALLQLPMWFTYNQGIMQRFTSLKNYKYVKYAHILSALLWTLMVGLSALIGVIATAMYVFCDPLSMQKIKKPDQIAAYFVLEIGNAIPGFSGIFMAGIISAGLSTLSTTFNSLAATIYIDFIKPILSNNFIEKYEVLTIKLVVLAIGVLSTGLVYVIQHLGTVITAYGSISPIAYAPMIGIFISGLFTSYVNAKGAFWGGITTLILMSLLIGTAQWYKLKGLINYPTLPVSTSACQVNNENQTTTFLINSTVVFSDEVPSIYKLSFHYYMLVGCLVLLTAALIISYFTRDKNYRVREDLLSPILRQNRGRKGAQNAYNTVEMALIVTDTAAGNNV